MNTKIVQWLILAGSGAALILFAKIMLDMSGAVVEMTGHVGAMSRNVAELNGQVTSLVRDVNEMNANMGQMNQTMQRMDRSIQGMGYAITRGSEQFQKWNPGDAMQQMMPGTRSPAR